MSALDLSVDDLADRLSAWGEPRYRAKQVYAQLWRRSAEYAEMSDIAPGLRERLIDELPIGVDVLEERTADRGATRKALLQFEQGHVVEAVLMGYRDRVTVCVSSQAGCAMGCTFCATGQMGLLGNLSSGQIAGQVRWARRGAAMPEGGLPCPKGGCHASGFDAAAAHERRLHGHGGADRRLSTTYSFRRRPEGLMARERSVEQTALRAAGG